VGYYQEKKQRHGSLGKRQKICTPGEYFLMGALLVIGAKPGKLRRT
jgi:hypothetical protein